MASGGKPLAKGAWSNPEGRMTVARGKPVPAGGKVSARITYAGTPHVAVRAPWDGGFVWAKTPGGQPWVATAVQMEGCDMFWPCIDYPTYEPDRIDLHITVPAGLVAPSNGRSEEHTSELQSLMRISYAVFCLKQKTHNNNHP